MHLLVRVDAGTVIAAAVQRDVDGIAKRSHRVSIAQTAAPISSLAG
jgi:hypothetical protein